MEPENNIAPPLTPEEELYGSATMNTQTDQFDPEMPADPEFENFPDLGAQAPVMNALVVGNCYDIAEHIDFFIETVADADLVVSLGMTDLDLIASVMPEDVSGITLKPLAQEFVIPDKFTLIDNTGVSFEGWQIGAVPGLKVNAAGNPVIDFQGLAVLEEFNGVDILLTQIPPIGLKESGINPEWASGEIQNYLTRDNPLFHFYAHTQTMTEASGDELLTLSVGVRGFALFPLTFGV